MAVDLQTVHHHADEFHHRFPRVAEVPLVVLWASSFLQSVVDFIWIDEGPASLTADFVDD